MKEAAFDGFQSFETDLGLSEVSGYSEKFARQLTTKDTDYQTTMGNFSSKDSSMISNAPSDMTNHME